MSLMRKSSLFYGINDDGPYTLSKCCALERVLYEDGKYIFRMEGPVNTALVLLRGEACAIQKNFRGHQEHIYHIEEGELFGQSYSRARTPVLPVSAVAERGCEVLSLNYQRMIIFRPLAYNFHIRFAHSMLRLASEYNVKPENRLEHIRRRTTREEFLFYLSRQVMAKGGGVFDISHSCQKLVEHSCVD